MNIINIVCLSGKNSIGVISFFRIVRNMPHAFEITFEGKQPVLKKGKLEPIKVTVDTRTGNKKVIFFILIILDM